MRIESPRKLFLDFLVKMFEFLHFNQYTKKVYKNVLIIWLQLVTNFQIKECGRPILLIKCILDNMPACDDA